MNILVTGANGQLGNEIRQVSRKSKDRYIFTDINQSESPETTHLDITDIQAIRSTIARCQIKAIINCAAYTNVDKAEDQPDLCRQLNAEAPGNLAQAIKETDGLLIHISTDYVFGATTANTPLREDRIAKPQSIYGTTKLQGEQAVIASGCRHIIIRTAWLYSEYGHNFVKTILHHTAAKPQINVVFDQCGTPTYAYDLAAAIFDILENRKYLGRDGIYHYTDEGLCSWYDFAVTIARCAGHTQCDIQPCHTDEYPSKVRRPAYSVLDKTKIKQTFGIQIPHWTHSLHTCIQNILQQQSPRQ